MLSYTTADGYRSAIAAASRDERWSEAERRHLVAIAEDAGNTGEPWGSGRIFRHGGMRFLAHTAAEGVNLGRAS